MPVPLAKKKKVLIICGPTATGKTRLAVSLIKSLFRSDLGYLADIISVDSRQVFRKMDIGTGKDLPSGAKLFYPNLYWQKRKVGYYLVDGVCIWGYDLADPNEDFSVFSYVARVNPVVKYIWRQNKFPVLVGGSGLYLKSLVDGIETVAIPRNNKLREYLSAFSVHELFNKLAEINPEKAAALNLSDKRNPRRLIRAIEISQWVLANQGKIKSTTRVFSKDSDPLFIGLLAPKDKLAGLIEKRVLDRWKKSFKEEVLNLLKNDVSWSCQSMSSMGYKHIRDFLEGKKSEQEFLSEWIRDEISYSKRQMIWFKKDKRIIWFNVADANYFKKVEERVLKWYYKS